jgi:peptide methionine sulfoxide reductase msrA/msrB
MTPKNVRHCVNSISLDFKKSKEAEDNSETAYFAGGCFWGIEAYFQKQKGVVSTQAGYMGGDKENPTYQEVSSQKTGHAETVKVVFDPSKVSFEELAKVFFEIHDPTQVNRQGPDTGSQYRSAIFYTSPGQKQTAEKLIALLKKKDLQIATQLVKADVFWPAEDYHQKYYLKQGKESTCLVREKRF